MKYYETTFEEYLHSCEKYNIHPKLNNVFKQFPKNIQQLTNLIFYGASGIGKYTQALRCIKRYSQSDLKYEKKISIELNNSYVTKSYYIKISDIHYEVDMSLLGCNSKLLWNDIYTQIIDIISAKQDKSGIILCKNFNKISSDLLDCFYSYIQKNDILSSIHIVYILVTEDLSFISNNILSTCEVIYMGRPSKTTYNKILNTKLSSTVKLENIVNIKNIKDDIVTKYNIPHKIICDKIIKNILECRDMLLFREYIYDIFIYNLNMNDCVWYIINELIQNKHIKQQEIILLMLKIYTFFQYYNNNYRPIYHVESLFYYLLSLVHNYPIL
jgi:hypothetical protein